MELLSPEAVASTAQIASNPVVFAAAMTQLVKQVGVKENYALVAWSGIFGGLAVVGLSYFPDLWTQLVTLGIGFIGTGLVGLTFNVADKVGKKK